MTTDTVPKMRGRELTIGGVPTRITGIAKGAAMIGPNMGTMLSLIMTDASIRVKDAQLALTDAMGCTLDWANAQTSLNRKQAWIDRDGYLRFVVSGEDPGTPNWLDTMGHKVGVMQLRWTGCAQAPSLAFRRTNANAVRSMFPADTPTITHDERDAILRERAIGAQMRSYW